MMLHWLFFDCDDLVNYEYGEGRYDDDSMVEAIKFAMVEKRMNTD